MVDVKEQRIYYGKRIEPPKVLANRKYKGYGYVIITLGSHPCSYILLPKGHKYHGKFYDDIDLRCHGGLTYSRDYLLKKSHDNLVTDEEWVIGWDYAHLGDYLSFPEMFLEGDDDGHQWTLQELVDEVEETINQLIEED